jgi:hypothetical protein
MHPRLPEDDLFAAETNRLIIDRLPMGAAAFAAVFAVAWVVEHRTHPERDAYFAAVYALELLTACAAVVLS